MSSDWGLRVSDRVKIELGIWQGSDGPAKEFADAWVRCVAGSPHANYTLSLDYLRHQAVHGEHSIAVLLEQEARRGAMVLRESGDELVCGFPWRWQIVLEGADAAKPEGVTPEDADWFFAHAKRIAGSRRLRFFSPGQPEGPLTGYVAGYTVMIDLVHESEDQLAAALDPSRRRLARRSEKQGYMIDERVTAPMQRSFAELMIEMHDRRHGITSPPLTDAVEPGESWREWELPWHWLIVAAKDGVIGAGLGCGRMPNGMVDGRASASSEEAMKAGANSLVWWEGIRRAKLAGHTWMNLCGATTYKRQFGGVLVPIQCRLGGGLANELPNLVEKMAKAARPVAARMVKGLRDRARKSTGKSSQGGA